MSNVYNFEATKELLACSDLHYLICIDNSGNYSYTNTLYANNFSHIHHNFIGRPYDITMHHDDAGIAEEVIAKCYAFPGKLFPVTLRLINGHGGYIITQWEFTLITENGFPAGVFCLGYDVTEYEQVKDKFFIINNTLELKREILGAIAYEQSHIVRAPLANILGLVNVLKHYPLDPEAEVIVHMLQESSTLLDDVIKSIVKKKDH